MIRRTEMQLRQVPGALSRHLKTVALATAAAALVALLAVGVIGAADPLLIFVEVQRDNAGSADGLQGAISVSVSPDGKHLYAAAWNESAVALFSRDPTTGALTFVEVHKDGVGGVDGLANAYSVTVSPDGNHVYAAGEADSAVAVFSRNSTQRAPSPSWRSTRTVWEAWTGSYSPPR